MSLTGNNNQNPYSSGSPRVDAERSSAYPDNINGYYNNPPVAAGNPYSGGVPDSYAAGTEYAAERFQQLIDTRTDLNTSAESDSPVDPSAADYYDDLGYGRSGTGRS